MINLDSNTRKFLGKRIREERIKNNLTIEQLAEIIDVSASYLGVVERGDETSLNLDNIIKLSELFGVTLDSLLKEYSDTTESRIDYLKIQIQDLDENDYITVLETVKLLSKRFKQDKVR